MAGLLLMLLQLRFGIPPAVTDSHPGLRRRSDRDATDETTCVAGHGIRLFRCRRVQFFFIGLWADEHEIYETCAARGQMCDRVYRSENWQEPSQIFPIHNKCNDDYDLVLLRVNPALLIFAVLTVAFVIALFVSIVNPVRIPSK